MTTCLSVFRLACDFCMAIGGIGTFATFILMIYDLRNKTKQIKSIQEIQSHQLETLYEPDIRISSWTGQSAGLISDEIVINNHGQDLLIIDIVEPIGKEILNKEGMKNWFPRYINRDDEIHIPLSRHLHGIESHKIIIKTRNSLGTKYESEINILKGKPTIQLPIKLKAMT